MTAAALYFLENQLLYILLLLQFNHRIQKCENGLHIDSIGVIIE